MNHVNDIASNPELLATYQRDGVVCLRGVIDNEWLACLSDATDDAMREPGPFSEWFGETDPPGFFGDINSWWRIKGFEHFIRQSPVAIICAGIMQSATARFFYDQLLVKEMGCEDRTPWHQDQPYWSVCGGQIISIWVPMDPIPEASSLEYVAGSHRWNEFNPQHFSDASPYAGTHLPALPDIESERDRHNILRFEMEPGDALVFQAMIVHGAPGNRSATYRRRAYSTRWLGDDARFAERQGEVAMPNFATGLADGEPYSGERFPLIFGA
ncbi:MAG: ectoine hydroxylase-related dioxygenase (phytanoyl-CoA dioxygenase family) [Parasphingorhabdus sp.]|jgi:ectoine hydroxylase-related dioxygenase (phytanoyl-CoA dioxygenase family)